MGDQLLENDLSDEYEDLGQVTLTLDDGTEADYDVLAIYPAADRQYVAIRPSDRDDLEEVYFYRYIFNGEDEDPEIDDIESEEEYDIAADAFDELLDEALYDEN